MLPEQYREHLQVAAETLGLPVCDLRPAQTADLLTVERTIGMTLPQEYVAFLLEVGCGEEFGGLSLWHHFDLTLAGNTLEASHELAAHAPRAPRSQPHRRLPRGFLPIYDSLDGSVYGYIPRSSNEYERQIYVWDTDANELRQVADDFAGFLDYLVEGLDMHGAGTASDEVIF